jgi:FkbH-like protein
VSETNGLPKVDPAPVVDARSRIDALIDEGRCLEAKAALAAYWQRDSNPAVAAFVNGRADRIRGRVPLVPCRIHVLRSFTVESAVPLLRAQAFAGGIDAVVSVGEFNTYAQDILDPASSLYATEADVVVLAVQARDLCPALVSRFADLEPEEVRSAIEQVVASYERWFGAFRSRSSAHLIVHLLEIPEPSHGILDAQIEPSQRGAITTINERLRAACRAHRAIYALDINATIARRGRDHWQDERMWTTVRMPIAGRELIHLARDWARFLHPITGRVAKCLVCDLDNTLWGGVIGEDGMTGIRLGTEHPGAAFQALQRVILDLAQRGVILAIASKNNIDDALEVLRTHPGMLLKPEHFAALRINWRDKATNLREIAAELNIGVDSLAFIDDNPVERTWVSEQLPEVTVIDLPTDPYGYARALREAMVFERLTLTAEDRERGRQYAEQRVRAELQAQAGSIEEFYESLAQEVDIAHVTPMTLARVAQLTNKTNQFNLTTRRYSEQQVQEMADSPDWRVYSIRVRDRFGDNGLVGVAIAHYVREPDRVVCELDSFLLSCRVIGRTVETSFLATIIEEARQHDATLLRAWFLPTKKNAPAKDFLATQGFMKIADADGTQTWEFDLTTGTIEFPRWMRRLSSSA